MSRQCPHASRNLRERIVQGFVHHDVREVVVIQPRTAQLRIVHVEAQRLHEVQHGPRAGRQTDCRTRVTGDLRLPENDVQHVLRPGG